MLCERCGQMFEATRRRTRFCSRLCSNQAKSKNGLQFTQGRWFVRTRNGGKQIFSRCLMEAHLGRDLPSEEHVHHINGDKTDDRLENLVVLHQSDHHAIHVARGDYGRKPFKLTFEQIEEILSSEQKCAPLAAKFGVTDGAIRYHRRKAILRSQGRA